jgi:Ran GTPase-activating protein (RanGAP) involved in mRNA processing and transport
MSNNGINHKVTGEAAARPGKALAGAIAANKVLQELNLSYNVLKPEFARELAKGLEKNRELRKLTLSNNQLKSGGAQAIAAAVKSQVRTVVLISLDYQQSLTQDCTSHRLLQLQGG